MGTNLLKSVNAFQDIKHSGVPRHLIKWRKLEIINRHVGGNRRRFRGVSAKHVDQIVGGEVLRHLRTSFGGEA